eukprot:TRINITY_DN16900_c0_g1_i1.p1 TRINITY_DN16900_c0_g1~~TRINITY_DN16900_c0_g1_i1.p1  ORF type:complete len:150 (+),score=34.80 TRINITY_DN16900_c0_g1_i1:46-495(+)
MKYTHRSIIFILFLSFFDLFGIINTIKCFTCNKVENITCPGWKRPLVDSVADLGDTSGLYTHCVTITMGEEKGKVVEQSIMPGSTHCSSIFLESWEMLLNSKWNQEVHISCCDQDGCNGDQNSEKSQNSVFKPGWISSVLSLIFIGLRI